jgi:type III restriction enzyme
LGARPHPEGAFRLSADHSYEAVFIVATETMKHLCEPKRVSEMEDPVVRAKAYAAATWCQHATDHANAYSGKPWAYLLIPHTSITGTATLAELANSIRVTA